MDVDKFLPDTLPSIHITNFVGRRKNQYFSVLNSVNQIGQNPGRKQKNPGKVATSLLIGGSASDVAKLGKSCIAKSYS